MHEMSNMQLNGCRPCMTYANMRLRIWYYDTYLLECSGILGISGSHIKRNCGKRKEDMPRPLKGSHAGSHRHRPSAGIAADSPLDPSRKDSTCLSMTADMDMPVIAPQDGGRGSRARITMGYTCTVSPTILMAQA
ncbi:hypothetical protein BD309DRAFT_1038792 [Dichomitus squalens]|nr:hypothetical protein BD309DRAFT_1038792 [Dichomitus squalens]